MTTSTIKDFQLNKKLGEGAFSTVYSVKRISDGTQYAMKKVKMGKLSSKEKENALNEIRILASINHPNVIGYKEAFFENSQGNLCIVMEQADNGDLLQAIEKKKKTRQRFTEKQIWHYFVQIVHGLKALHDLKIVHRDIKCANIFLTKNNMTKLGDLNVSKVSKKGMMHTQTGTPYYASPEVWKDKPYDNKSDIWSLGCVLYEMTTLLPPFRAQSMQGLSQKVQRGNYEPLGKEFSADLSNIIKKCLTVDPKKRPSCDTILSTPGLLNHITGTLQNLEFEIEQGKEFNENQDLLSTIILPRNLGQISSRLPKPQYKLQRSKSLAIDIERESDIKLNTSSSKAEKSQANLIKLIKDQREITGASSAQNIKVYPKKERHPALAVQSSLPTIEEEQNTGMRIGSALQERRAYKYRQQSEVRHSHNYKSEQPDYAQREKHGLPSAKVQNRSEQMGLPPKAKPAQSGSQVRSVDVYSAKVARINSQLRRQPTEMASDASTRVSSRGNVGNEGLYTPKQDYRSQLNLLPQINHKKQYSIAGEQLDPPFTKYERYTPTSARGRNQTSEAMSRALGFDSNRYGGPQQAIRQARQISNDIKRQYAKPITPRGPCPQYLQYSPAIKGLIRDSEQIQSSLQLHQYQRRMEAIY